MLHLTDRSFKKQMPRDKEQYETIRQEKKALISEHALRLFSQNSYHGVTMGMIAESAGISKGLIYNYFKSKEELLFQILEGGMQEIMEQIDPNHDGILEHYELMHFIEVIFEWVGKRKEFWRLYYGLALQQDVMKVVDEKLSEWLQPYYRLLMEYFEKKGAEDPLSEAVYFMGMMDGLVFNYLADPDVFPLDGIIRKLKNMYK